MAGPLNGVRIIEIAGLGPGPFAAMMLADHGAEVIRIDRPGGGVLGPAVRVEKDILSRSRKSVALDLKQPEGAAVLKDLIATADGLIEGFRPGVMERLGLGPDELSALNPRLVYGRMTGWGQEGPLAQTAGHDINYIALSGVLHAIGPAGGKPVVPINLVGDFGGGGMLLAFGMVCALLQARATGSGQIVDAAMTDGSALLMSMMWSFRAMGLWQDRRGINMLDGGAHFYDTFETADGKYVALGAIEPQFYHEMRARLGLLNDADFNQQFNPAVWQQLKSRLAEIFRTKTRDEWVAVFEGSDACFSPVLSMEEALKHPHNAQRGTFVTAGGVDQPAPAPRYSRTQTVMPVMTKAAGQDGDAVLRDIGYDDARIAALRDRGILG